MAPGGMLNALLWPSYCSISVNKTTQSDAARQPGGRCNLSRLVGVSAHLPLRELPATGSHWLLHLGCLQGGASLTVAQYSQLVLQKYLGRQFSGDALENREAAAEELYGAG